MLETTTETGLSRKSALNDRYFEKEKQRSRSLDNLLQPDVVTPPVKLANLGLSSSKLNERYHSLERIGETSAVSNVEYMTRNELAQERKYSRITRTTEPNIEEEDLTIDFEYPDIQSVSQTGRSEDDKSSYIRSQTRFIKSQYPGKFSNTMLQSNVLSPPGTVFSFFAKHITHLQPDLKENEHCRVVNRVALTLKKVNTA